MKTLQASKKNKTFLLFKRVSVTRGGTTDT